MSMSSCGDDKTYYCTESGHKESYITIYEDSDSSSGSGKANKVYYDGTGWWDITGKFTYNDSSVTVTSGTYRNQSFDNVVDSASSSTLKVCGKTYKY